MCDFILQPGQRFEYLAFGREKREMHCLERLLIPRVIALVAPILHAYDCVVNLVRTIYFIATYPCQKASLDGPKVSLRDLVLRGDKVDDDDVGSLRAAGNSLLHGLSSILEMPEKFFLGRGIRADKINYLGKEFRYSL